MVMVKVLCLADRFIGDDRYASGEEYEMEEDRLVKYQAYFSEVPELEEEEKNTRGARDKDGGKGALNKGMTTGPMSGSSSSETKGWPNREGQNVNLDGSPVNE